MTEPPDRPSLLLKIFLTSALVSLFLFFTSAFIALKLGAMPWPIIFSIVVCGGLLRILSRHITRHDVNTAQAGGTIGGLMAAAVVFVLPGLYFQSSEVALPSPWMLALLAGSGGLLGVLLSDRVRPRYVDEMALPYPAGQAGGELIREGFDRGRLFSFVVLAALATGALTLLRDHWDLYVIPVAVGSVTLIFLLSMMGVGGGYILGPRTGFNWFGGAVFGMLILAPLARGFSGLLISGADITTELWVQNVGMGLMLGSGLAHILFSSRLRGVAGLLIRGSHQWSVIVLTVIGLAALVLAGVAIWAALVVVVFTWVLVPVAANITGATNLDPLEQFGLLVTLLVMGMYAVFGMPMPEAAKYVAAFYVAVTTAVAGDIGHDFKSAVIVGTPSERIVRADLIAVAVTAPALPILLDLMRHGLAGELFTPTMPAPQAKIVFNTLSGLIDLPAFFGALGFAAAFEAIRWLRRRYSAASETDFLPESRFLLIPLGIGIFLGWPLSFVIALGGLIRWWIDRRHPGLVRSGVVLAAGIMGGEGIVSFLTSAMTAYLDVEMQTVRLIGAGVLAGTAFALMYVWRQRPDHAA